MNHPVLRRILLLDSVADERLREHHRRSSTAALVAGLLSALALLEYRLLVEHTVAWDLIVLIYAMGGTKIAFMFRPVRTTSFRASAWAWASRSKLARRWRCASPPTA